MLVVSNHFLIDFYFHVILEPRMVLPSKMPPNHWLTLNAGRAIKTFGTRMRSGFGPDRSGVMLLVEALARSEKDMFEQ